MEGNKQARRGRGETGTLIRTVTGLTSPTYTYTNATEISDAGAIQDQLLFLIDVIRDTTVENFQTYVRRVLRTSSESGLGRIVTVNGSNVTHNGDIVVARCQVTVNGLERFSDRSHAASSILDRVWG